jgi:LmbE family N-acetylglucosaminyl deacetylase
LDQGHYKTAMTLINIISPHIDDAIFSLGAYLERLQRYHQLCVINIFSLSTFAFGKLMPTSIATAIRKAEDKIALGAIDAHSVHYLDLPEALLRGYTLESQLNQPDDHRVVDRNLILEIGKHLDQIIPPRSIVFSPAAFGSHVDHVHVRLACEQLDARLVYYADLPYVTNSIRYNHQSAVILIRDMNSKVVYSNDGMTDRHIHLCRYYESQFEQRFVYSMMTYLCQNHFTLWSHHEFPSLNLDIK